MSLDQIRTFVVVAEEGNMRRAAQRLHLTQPPISRQITQLEDELGERLFARVPRGMQLLPAGAAFLSHAKDALRAVERGRAAVQRPAPTTGRQND